MVMIPCAGSDAARCAGSLKSRTHALCPRLGTLLQLMQQRMSLGRVGKQMDVY
jgi:hypothetical protein